MGYGYDSAALLDKWGLGNSPGCQILNDNHQVIHSATITTCLPGPYPTYYPGNDYTTVYTTEYIQVCPTEHPCDHGTKTETYTITETCTGNKNDYTKPVIPPNFTTYAKVCDVCEGKPTLTITCPSTQPTAYVNNKSGVNYNNNTGSDYKKYQGYIQAQPNIASTGRTEIAAVLLGSFIGLVAWLL